MKVLLVLVAFIANAWATSLLNNRIFNGFDATPDKFPYMLSLQNLTKESESSEYDEYDHICGGAIISPTWGLTAAHCVETKLVLPRVVVGITNLKEQTSEGQTVPVEKTKKFGRLVQPIHLPPADTEPSLSDFAIFSGWGRAAKIDPWGKYYEEYPDQLQYTELMLLITNDQECLAHRKFFCTLGINRSSGTDGDGGGPLEQNGKLVGIYSAGDTLTESINFFCKVSAFISFIKSYVEDLP